MPRALRISVFLNLALVAAMVLLLSRDRQPAARSAVPPASRLALARAETPQTTAPVDDPRSRSAPHLVTPTAIAELERLGFSRGVVIAALREDFNRRWDRRLVELETRHAPKPLPDREYVEFARLRDAEEIREMKTALGEDGYRAWDKERTLRAVNSAGLPMTAAEAERAYQLQKDFDEKHKELEMAMEDGVADRADAATLQAQARDALERELEGLFGRQRLNAMRGITDPLANAQWRYGDLRPTPEQASAVVSIEDEYRAREAALTGRLSSSSVDSMDVATELAAISEAREQKLREIFGAEAYEQYKRDSDTTFKTLRQFADAWELKDNEIGSVYDSLHRFHEQAERTRTAAAIRESAGQPVNWREINAAIEEVRQQTEANLQTLLGPERLHRLKQNGLLTQR